MSESSWDFRARYGDAFESYLDGSGEGGLSAAYELGRTAVAQRLSVLDLAATHHEVLVGALRDRRDDAGAEHVALAAGEFFLESLSAFELVQRALQETREAALVERRHATVLRRLSTFLADASLALDAAGSLDEMLQLVAEHAREVIGANWCVARLALMDDGPPLGALSSETGEPPHVDIDALGALYAAMRPPGGVLRMTGAELARHPAHRALADQRRAPGPRGWLAAALTALDGRELGLIQLFDKQQGEFSELDEAVLVQLSQMASAAVERAQLYRVRQ